MEPSPHMPPLPIVDRTIGLNSEEIRALAIGAGFNDAGLVALPYSQEPRDAARYENWINLGRAASMDYLARRSQDGRLARSAVSVPFPWARSAVICFASYRFAGLGSPASADPINPDPVVPSPADSDSDSGQARIARYARTSKPGPEGTPCPSDYHKVLLKRLEAMEKILRQRSGEFESRVYVDTGPVSERALAVAAGLGWTGKNTCLIHPQLGSFGFLAVLLTSLPVQEPAPLALPDRCGTCTRCLEACPTGALVAPGELDARRCISYLTIEHRGPIGEELMSDMGSQIFGCDICQDVCPWNQKWNRKWSREGNHSAPPAEDPELTPRPELADPTLDWLAALSESDFERLFNGSPVRRAKYHGLLRNVAIAIGNSCLARFGPKLQGWADSDDEGLRSAARWALDKLHRAQT